MGGSSAKASNHVVLDFDIGGQTIALSLDTGSTRTWLVSTLDTNVSETSPLGRIYDPQKSSTYHDDNNPDDAGMCQGPAGQLAPCKMGLDDISLGGLTASQMAFGLASSFNPSTYYSNQSGTIGFGRLAGQPEDWVPRDKPFWHSVTQDSSFPDVFAVDLYRDRDGTIDLGWVDHTKYNDPLLRATIDLSQQFWNIAMDGFAVGDDSLQDITSFGGVVDTGGPNISLPKPIAKAYFDRIGGSSGPNGTHFYPCAAYPPPKLVLRIAAGDNIVLDGTFLVYPPSQSGQVTCQGRIFDVEKGLSNLGACLFDQKYIVFDQARAQIGFADKASL